MDWSWAGQPIDARSQFPLERAELIGLLTSLDADDWRRATVCPGWTVHDIVAHVVHDYMSKLSGKRDEYASPGPLRGEDLPTFLHRLNQEFVDVASRWSPRVLIDLLDHLGPQLDHLWLIWTSISSASRFPGPHPIRRRQPGSTSHASTASTGCTSNRSATPSADQARTMETWQRRSSTRSCGPCRTRCAMFGRSLALAWRSRFQGPAAARG
jgi:uncharacterized protein (TIGR03083 family)